MDLPDQMLAGRYRLEAPLGAGGMATVHRAYDVLLDRQVAIKILASNIAASPDHVERFGREGRAMAAITHPNLVAIHDVGRADDDNGQGLPFLVMELVPGGTLAERIASDGPLDPAEVADIVGGLASALETLHRAGIVHRDVKPQNVLLAPSGPKLADLGVVRVGDPADPDAADLTAPGSTPGTLRFLAPEVILGGPAGPQADAYALAMVAFEALTGRSPRLSNSLGDLVNGAWQPALSVFEARPELGEAFDSAFAAALDVDPDRRSEPLAFAEAVRAAAGSWAAAVPSATGAPDPLDTEPAVLTGMAALNPMASRPSDPTTVDNRPAPIPRPAPAPPIARVIPEAESHPEVEPRPEVARAPEAGEGDPRRRVLVAIGIVVIVLGFFVVAGLLASGGAGPGTSPTPTASTTTPTAEPSALISAAPSDVTAAARQAVDAVIVAIEKARGGRDGLKGADASELTALANDVRRALDAGDFAAARSATAALAERVQDIGNKLDKDRRKALEDAVDALRESLPPA